MKEEDKIDLGKWNVPTKWDEITLKQFQEISKYYGDKEDETAFDVRDVLHIFTNKTVDEINALPMYFTNQLLEKLSFLGEKMKEEKPTNSIVIDGEKYVINVMEQLKTGEFVSVDSVIKNDPRDYISILAIICRKQGEVYDSRFEAEEFEKRVKMFGEQPITKIMPIINFFLSLYILRETHFQLYSAAEEGLNHIQQNINSSEKFGVFQRRSLNLRMKKLRKLLKSSKSI